jgi:hypothetical protein
MEFIFCDIAHRFFLKNPLNNMPDKGFRVLKRAQRCTFTGSEADGTFFEIHIT